MVSELSVVEYNSLTQLRYRCVQIHEVACARAKAFGPKTWKEIGSLSKKWFKFITGLLGFLPGWSDSLLSGGKTNLNCGFPLVRVELWPANVNNETDSVLFPSVGLLVSSIANARTLSVGACTYNTARLYPKAHLENVMSVIVSWLFQYCAKSVCKI